MALQLPAGHWGTRAISCYEKVEQIGEGTYGQVYKARNKVTNAVVALKKIRVHSENFGLPVTAIREIKILNEISHPSMVRLLEIVTSVGEEDDEEDDKGTPRTDRKRRGSLYIVLEYLDHDLAGLLDLNITFSAIQIKGLLKQLLDVLGYVHDHKYVHRDIKCSNLLIDNRLRLKLADFGLARRLSDVPADLTNRVITLWYRPPELLLGATRYGPSVDCWGVGCIVAELIIGKPLFPAKVEQEQLDLIFQVCGTPDSTNWPGHDGLPGYDTMMPKATYTCELKQYLVKTSRKVGTDALMTPEAVDLITRLLTLDPLRRASARKALDTRYFRSHPICPDNVPDLGPLALPERGGSYHEFQTKKKRKEDGALQQDAKRAQRKKDKRNTSHSEAAGSKTDYRRATERSSSSSPQPKSTWPRSGPLDSGYNGPTTQPSVALPRSGTTENWAPPLPPPSLLDPPPPPRLGSASWTAHDSFSQEHGAPPLPPDTCAYGATSSSKGVSNVPYLPQNHHQAPTPTSLSGGRWRHSSESQRANGR